MKDIIKALAAIFAAVPAARIYVTETNGRPLVEIQAESDNAARSIAEVLGLKLELRVASETQWIGGDLYGDIDVAITGPHHRRVELDEDKLRAAAKLAQEAVA